MYGGFGPTLASEYLAKKHGVKIGREALRQLMMAAGLWGRRRQKVHRVHQWRPRRSFAADQQRLRRFVQEAMYDKYKNDVEFLLVYIREAHATDGWQVAANQRDGVLIETAQDFDQKEGHATACVRKLDIQFTTLVDGMDNQVESDYTAWPDSLYLVGKDGRVAWKGRPGPRGLRPPELEAAIQKALQSN